MTGRVGADTAAPGQPTVIQVAAYYPPHLGGVEATAQIIAESLAATRRVEVLTSACGAAGRPRVERRGQLTVRRLRSLEIAHTPVAPALLPRLLRLSRDCVVHVHVAQAFFPEMVWLATRLRRRRYVAHFHLDVDPSGAAGLCLAAYKRLLLARVLRAASRVVVLSAEQAEFVVGRYRVRRDRVAVVPNAAPPGSAGAVDRDRRSEAPLRLLSVGRLSPQKNLPLLLQAARLMSRPAELVIVGDGPDRRGLEQLAARLGLRTVRLVGRRDHGDLGAWYRWADVFVLSSRREGMPLAALEAMSSGLPVVATDAPGLRELCASAGVVVRPDPAALAGALDRLATDPALRRRLARRSLARVAGASWEASIGQLEELYLTVAR